MIGTSDGKQYEDQWEETIAFLKGLSKMVNPDRFDEAMKKYPDSNPNLEDRRNEPESAKPFDLGGPRGSLKDLMEPVDKPGESGQINR